jgi:hypothetical protein
MRDDNRSSEEFEQTIGQGHFQGCQIFIYLIYQNGGKYTKSPLKYQMAVNVPKMAVIYSKRPYNIPTYFIPRPSKIYRNLDFWFENIPSGNPGHFLENDGSIKNHFGAK